MKRLVEIDPQTGTTKEFDHRAIRRSAEVLKEYLLGLSSQEDKYHLREQVLPIVEEALSSTLILPFDGRKEPLSWEATEGLLPREYLRAAARFWNYVTGMGGLGSDLIQPIHKDGKVYAWMEFED